MSDPLKSLKIAHLRGSTQPFTLPFKQGTNLTIVYGENGSGKTTICDALDLLGNGEVGSLENRKGIRKKEPWWPSVGKTKSDIAVELKTQSASITAAVGKTGCTVTPSDHGLEVRVLRRATVQNLIEAEPGKRYEAIRHFIDVSGVEQAEDNLRSAIKSLSDDLNGAASTIATNTEELQRDWSHMGSPGQDARSWAAAIGDDQEECKRLANERTSTQQLKQALAALTTARSALTTARAAIAPAETQQAQAEAALEQARADITDASNDVVDILRSAKAYFDKHPDFDVCPLCQSAENAADLAQQTQERIAGFTQLQRYETAKRDLDHKQKATSRAKEIASERAEAYDAAKASWQKAAKDLPAGNDPDESAFDAWHQTVTEDIDKRVAAIDEAAGKISLLDRAKATLSNLITNEEHYATTAAIEPRLEALLEIVDKERKQFTDAILGQIADEVGRLYEEVHPGEGKDKIALQLDPKRRGSLNITAHFEGQDDTPPQAYFSDSHLDTLGLCIYLALAARTNPENTILVMDDVLGSVDEPLRL